MQALLGESLSDDDVTLIPLDLDPQSEFHGCDCRHEVLAGCLLLVTFFISSHRSAQCGQALKDGERGCLGSKSKLV